mgnify:CR=1 FL=1
MQIIYIIQSNKDDFTTIPTRNVYQTITLVLFLPKRTLMRFWSPQKGLNSNKKRHKWNLIIINIYLQIEYNSCNVNMQIYLISVSKYSVVVVTFNKKQLKVVENNADRLTKYIFIAYSNLNLDRCK